MFHVNVLDALRCFCWCLAEHLQADVVVSYRPDLVPRQPWHAPFCGRPTIASVRKQRLLKLLIDMIIATIEQRVKARWARSDASNIQAGVTRLRDQAAAPG